MIIGIIPNPLNHPDWPAIKAFLEPAAKRGGVPVLEAGEQVWAIYDPGLIGAATARPTLDGFGEVVLVGGVEHSRWIGQLDELIGRWLRDEGMTSVRAYGRKGWRKVLKEWAMIGESEGVTGYERQL